MHNEEKHQRNYQRNVVLAELTGNLWHTTHPDRFRSILADGAILPEPPLPESLRWKTSQGKDYYHYVRILGGVSLFDFDLFDADSYGDKYPMSSWQEFVPWRECWGSSVWIEIDRAKVGDSFITGPGLLSRQKAEKAYSHTIMPYIEAAHLGPLLKTVFKRAFLASPIGIMTLGQGFPMSKKDSEDQRRRLLRREYLEQVPPDKRVETLILEFHEWLVTNRPDLLSTVRERESYQQLKADLKGLYKLYK